MKKIKQHIKPTMDITKPTTLFLSSKWRGDNQSNKIRKNERR